MSTITIENSPITKTINYNDCIVIQKDNLINGLKELKNKFYNKETDTYGTFEGEEAISFLNILDYEIIFNKPIKASILLKSFSKNA